jgi:hypothetical protein
MVVLCYPIVNKRLLVKGLINQKFITQKPVPGGGLAKLGSQPLLTRMKPLQSFGQFFKERLLRYRLLLLSRAFRG